MDELKAYEPVMAADIDADEEWMRHLAGTSGPDLKPRQFLSLGGTANPDDDLADFFADMDRLLAEASGARDDDASPTDTYGAADEASLPDLPRPDWVDETLESVVPGSGFLPYDAYRANRHLFNAMAMMGDLARRNMYLAWKASDLGTVVAVKRSKNSIDSYYLIKELKNKDKEGKKRIFFPSRFPPSPVPGRVITVSQYHPEKLPRWKDLGSAEKQPSSLQEILFGLRVTSLASGDNEPSLSSWLSSIPNDDVGLLSIDLHGEAAKRFLSGENGSPATGLRRGLLRSLQSHTEGLGVICIWVAPRNKTDQITLFLAMRMVDARHISDAIELDTASRFVRSMEAHGVEVIAGGKTHPIELGRFYGVSEKDLAACDLESTSGFHPHDFVEIPPDGDEREYTPESGFATREQISQRHERVAQSWLRRVHANGLPSWFTAKSIDSFRDYLLRSPDHAKRRAQIVALIKKKKAKPADRRELARLNCLDLPLTNVRFYKGSPAQFASLALASGVVVGSYCDSRHKAGLAKELYELVRRECGPAS